MSFCLQDYNKVNFDEPLITKYATVTDKMYKILDSEGFIKELCNSVKDRNISLSEKLTAEKEYLGYINYKNSAFPDGLYYAAEVKTYKNNSKPYVILYHLKTGSILKTKVVSANEYESIPFKENDILNVWIDDRFKHMLINGRWTKTDEKEKVMIHWEIIK